MNIFSIVAPMVMVDEWSIELDRGLHVLRYNDRVTSAPVQFVVKCTPPLNSLVLHPDRIDPVLRVPGCALVVRVIRKSLISVCVFAEAPQKLDAEITIEALEI